MTDPTPTSGTIVVGGTGRVAVEPDVADLRLGVAIARPTVADARSAAAAAMTVDPGRHRGGRRRPARHADDPAVGPAALRLP